MPSCKRGEMAAPYYQYICVLLVVRFPVLRLVLGLCVRMSLSLTVAMIILQNVARIARFDGFSLLKRISIFSVFWCFDKFTFIYFALSASNAVH